MTTVVVVVVNKSLDSKEQIRAVFLRLDVNILVFYHFTKSFYPDIVFSTAAAFVEAGQQSHDLRREKFFGAVYEIKFMQSAYCL